MKTCAACDYPHNHASQLACQRCKSKTFKLRPHELIEHIVTGQPA